MTRKKERQYSKKEIKEAMKISSDIMFLGDGWEEYEIEFIKALFKNNKNIKEV